MKDASQGLLRPYDIFPTVSPTVVKIFFSPLRCSFALLSAACFFQAGHTFSSPRLLPALPCVSIDYITYFLLGKPDERTFFF